MPGFQPARSTVVARWLQDRGETGRAVFEFAEGVRTGDCEKRNREPLRPSSETAVYRRLVTSRARTRFVARAAAAEVTRRKSFSWRNPPPYVGGYHPRTRSGWSRNSKRALSGSEEFWYAGPAFPESRRALLLASHWGGPEPKRRK